MEEGKRHRDDRMYQESWFRYQGNHITKINDRDDEEKCLSSTTTSSIGEASTVSNGSSMSSLDDIADDASSPSPSSSSGWSNSSRALFDLSEIMEQLPIKRGLSKFYQGKSESFTSLSRVESIEDLVKKTIPHRRNLKASKSYANGLNSYKSYTLPKPIISKKGTRGSSFSSFSSKRGSFISNKPPLHKHLEC